MPRKSVYKGFTVIQGGLQVDGNLALSGKKCPSCGNSSVQDIRSRGGRVKYFLCQACKYVWAEMSS